jgi:spermidine dehydrogenase
VRARKPFGRITIANSDAGADAMMEVAVEQAHRAVSELL